MPIGFKIDKRQRRSGLLVRRKTPGPISFPSAGKNGSILET
ncbi:MAG: hypothetical protein ACXWBS_04725 [Chthoniobacterales bacterium]